MDLGKLNQLSIEEMPEDEKTAADIFKVQDELKAKSKHFQMEEKSTLLKYKEGGLVLSKHLCEVSSSKLEKEQIQLDGDNCLEDTEKIIRLGRLLLETEAACGVKVGSKVLQ